jgi:predicted KAP-like P-loop ATPase
MTEVGAEAQFSADRPISRRADDLLGRRAFAEAIARAIAGWSGSDSLVVAICGAWGSGKSSVKNMILDALGDESFVLARRPKILEFNPWQVSGQDEIGKVLILEIGIALGQSFDAIKYRDLAKRWAAYAASIRVGIRTATLVRTLAVVALAGVLFGLSWVSPRIGAIVLGLLVATGLVAAILSPLDEWVRGVSVFLETRAGAREKSLRQIKLEATEALGQLPHPLLVVMDDVDRLTKAEIQEVFQLIRANADFPNLMYLLFFQREVVEGSLELVGLPSGREYLKKMVQIDLDLPCIESGKLEPVLFSRLDKLLQIETLGDRFDSSRWQRLFAFGLRPYLVSLRDVYRYTNTLSFHLGLLRRSDVLEVNVVDLMGLEVLRVFEPHIYQELIPAKMELTSGRGWETLAKAEESKSKARIEMLVSKASTDHAEAVREVLSQLFPSVEMILGGMAPGSGEHEEWLRDLRVCSRELFDRYFLFAIPEGDVSEGQVARFMAVVGDREQLVAVLKDAIARNQLDRLVGRLGARINEVRLDDIVPLMAGVFEIGDSLPRVPPSGWEVGLDRLCWLTMRRLLERQPHESERSRILRSAIESTGGLYLPLVALFFGADAGKESASGARSPLLIEDDARAVRECLLNRTRAAASASTLSHHPQLPFILYRWRDLGSDEEPRRWVERLISKHEGLLHFLSTFEHQVVETELLRGRSQVRREIKPDEIAAFVSVPKLAELVSGLANDKLTADEREVVASFKRALEPAAE